MMLAQIPMALRAIAVGQIDQRRIIENLRKRLADLLVGQFLHAGPNVPLVLVTIRWSILPTRPNLIQYVTDVPRGMD